jgi:hypothetical protein
MPSGDQSEAIRDRADWSDLELAILKPFPVAVPVLPAAHQHARHVFLRVETSILPVDDVQSGLLGTQEHFTSAGIQYTTGNHLLILDETDGDTPFRYSFDEFTRSVNGIYHPNAPGTQTSRIIFTLF